eukprot:229660-Rhodomonas_salina.1
MLKTPNDFEKLAKLAAKEVVGFGRPSSRAPRHSGTRHYFLPPSLQPKGGSSVIGSSTNR